ncbi:MAG: asparaginase [Alphaproteobacteria bacterium]|nr:asparaginase [Alphaproteobacteria bacterium]
MTLRDTPLDIAVTRGTLVESRHSVLAVIADANGSVREGWGDLSRPVFARSAIKPLQALPLLETGAADRFALTLQHIAIACASHMGEPRHVALVAEWLARIGLTEEHLACGAHDPLNVEAAYGLVRAGQAASQLHNNCSGKHTGFLTTAVHCGDPLQGYLAYDHPVQRRILATLAEVTGAPYTTLPYGIDGCGIPTVAAPLTALAVGMARLDDPIGQPVARAKAGARITEAMAAEPFFVSGTGQTTTVTMEAAGARTVLKTGAEGVYAATVRGRGLGIAVKAEDGNERGAALAMLTLLDRLGVFDAAATAALEAQLHPTLTNRGGTLVGRIVVETPPAF